MCTVTYIPTSSGFIFTSNRDEQAARQTIVPKFYKEDGVQLFYPKDEVAGGTWIGLSEKNRLVCLLNGGFVYHNPKLKFPKSRGVVVKALLKAENVLEEMQSLDLEGVAPFTLLVVDWCEDQKIYQLTWCREKKTIEELDSNVSKIWSSSTLYTQEMKLLRETWFKEEIPAKQMDVNKVLQFHQNENLGDKTTSLKMKREIVETISTTMVVREDDSLKLSYHDYVGEQELSYNNIFTLMDV